MEIKPLFGPYSAGPDGRFEIAVWPYAFGQYRIMIRDTVRSHPLEVDREL